MKFRKKAVVIEAVQFDGSADGVALIEEFMGQSLGYTNYGPGEIELWVPTLEGGLRASPKDWIIKGVKGEFYPCKPDIFAATYEEA